MLYQVLEARERTKMVGFGDPKTVASQASKHKTWFCLHWPNFSDDGLVNYLQDIFFQNKTNLFDL